MAEVKKTNTKTVEPAPVKEGFFAKIGNGIQNAWNRIPTPIKVGGGAALAFGAYKLAKGRFFGRDEDYDDDDDNDTGIDDSELT